MSSRIGSFALLALMACGGSSPPIQLQGEPLAISSLAGQWEGEYWGRPQATHGLITFFMSANPDSAFGDVVMLGPRGQLMMPADPAAQHRMHIHAPQSLRIDFVHVGFAGVTGTLEPYIAPDCDCVVTTTFNGNVVGDTISGTFITRGAMRASTDGTWRVVRRAGPTH